MKRSALGVVLMAVVATACNDGRATANEPASTTPASITVKTHVPENSHPSLPQRSPGASPSPARSSEDVHPIGWYAHVAVIDPVAGDVVKVFRTMFRARYPIRRMRLVDDYRGDDNSSMAADNASAFNCRRVTGGTAWSEHAYGRAIDVNPVENPYVSSSGKVLPPAGLRYADRSSRARGVIHHGDVVWRAFRSIGWGWGGDWRSFQDYQHFSATGR